MSRVVGRSSGRFHGRTHTTEGVFVVLPLILLRYPKESTFYLIVTDTEFAVTYFAYGSTVVLIRDSFTGAGTWVTTLT